MAQKEVSVKFNNSLYAFNLKKNRNHSFAIAAKDGQISMGHCTT